MEVVSANASLLEVVILLSAAIFVVMIFLRLKISPILGYFVAGAALGTHGFGVVSSSSLMDILAEFGIVFLLFLIGLELTLERLMAMRRHVFGLGSLQVIITAAIIIAIGKFCHLNTIDSIVIGCAFALSSTAIVLQVLQEGGKQSNQVGRLSIAILLMQDFMVVPLLVFISLLGTNGPQDLLFPILTSLMKAAVVLVIIFTVGRLLLRPFFKLIASTKSSELFIATTLLIVLGAAYSTEYLNLSMAMGAFMAGLLLAETEYRHEVEQVIFPFKSLLLGLFFMTVGMAINLNILIHSLPIILTISLILLIVKSLVIIGLAKAFGFRMAPAIKAGFLLAQSSEFALILFKLEASVKIIGEELSSILVAVIPVTMAFTPLMAKLGSFIADKIERPGLENIIENKEEIQKADVMDIDNHVIIAGFGRVGRMVAKMLSAEQVNYIAIDIDPIIVDRAQKEGFPIFQGDIGKLSTLRSLAIERAATVVVSIQNEVTTKKGIKLINENFPDIIIVARVPDFSDASSYKKIGAHKLVPETYETGLQIGAEVLASVGLGTFAISSLKERFRASDYAIPKSIIAAPGASKEER